MRQDPRRTNHPASPKRRASAAVKAALRAVEQAERAAFGSRRPQPTRFLVRNRVAWSVESLPALDHRQLPDPVVRDLPTPGARTMSSSRCSLVRLGKRARADNVRARAFFVDHGRALTLKVWAVAAERKDSFRELRVREELQRVGSYPAPDVISDGTIGDVDYLLEPVIFGVVPSSGQERAAAAVDLIGRLIPAYEDAGVDDRPLSAVLRSDFPAAFESTLDQPWVVWPTSSDRSRFVSMVAGLVERDLSLPCSLGHGDMNMSNVIRDDHGTHWLVDWERGGWMPVAFDVRKLLLTSQMPDAVHQRVAGVLRPFDAHDRSRYRWNEQLALGICNEIAIAPRQRAGSERAGRLPQFDAKLAARLSWAMELLS